jgi:SRSO17 transposase
MFLGYASPKGHNGNDGALSMPEGWFQEPERCQRAAIPEGMDHHTKPQLALAMLESALDGGVPARWAVGDEAYGSDRKLRRSLEAREQAYVLAVRSNAKPSTWPSYGAPGQHAVAELGASIPAERSQRHSCGEGAQGPRLYDWAYLPLRPALREGWVHVLLLRRHLVRTAELSYYLVYAPLEWPLEDVVRAAGARWTIEEMFKLAKGQVGAGPLRSPQLAGLAPAYHPGGGSGQKGELACPQHIPITVPEVRRLLVRLIWFSSHPPERVLARSRWRRQHQKTAQQCHRRRCLRQQREL